MSGSITIHNLDEATAGWIEREARRRGTNEETIALDLIQRGIACEGAHFSLPAYEDLDALAGTWTEEQAAEFAEATRQFEQVDAKLWR